MADTVTVLPYDLVYIRIGCEPSIAKELSQYFSFEVEGAKYSPAARKGHWDARIKLYSLRTSLLYAGLQTQLQLFCANRGYTFQSRIEKQTPVFDYEAASNFVKTLNIPDVFDERDFQIETLIQSVNNGRTLFLSPTGSGKSMSIYYLARYFNTKTLLVVPTANLLLQMQNDFKSYGYAKPIGQYGDDVKDDKQEITVATWQSIYEHDEEWFAQFGMVIVDEAHKASAKSLKGIMEKLPNCDLRFGFTGTLNGTKTHQMVLEGLFGPVKQVARTKELIERGILAPFRIKTIKLIHPTWAKKFISTKQEREPGEKKRTTTYPEEMEFLIQNSKRNNFLANLALSRKGNTLLLFQRIEDHGKLLYELIQKKDPTRKVFYIHGKIKATEREAIRNEIETTENCILVASYGTLSTGVNIKRLDNLIFGSPWKSQIINLQSIGRVLRPLEGKIATLYDVSDDMSWKSRLNHTLKHLIERLKIYNTEEFDYQIYDVELNYKEG